MVAHGCQELMCQEGLGLNQRDWPPRAIIKAAVRPELGILSPESSDVGLSPSRVLPKRTSQSLTGRTRQACEQENECVNVGLHL